MNSNKTVLISGCSTGLGLELTKQFSLANYNVIATARNIDTISHLKNKNITTLQLDVADSSSIKKCIETVINLNKKIDVLINNAGAALIGPILELDIKMLKEQYDANLFGAIELSQAVIPGMIDRKSGRIVNISSISGIISTPFAGAYCSSKAALTSISDAMRMELNPFGISVMDVQPGKIKSSFGETALKSANKFQSDNSYYKNIVQFIEKRATISQKNASNAEDMAKIIVEKISIKNLPVRIKIGNESFMLPFLKKVLPERIIDKMLSNLFGLNLLNKS